MGNKEPLKEGKRNGLGRHVDPLDSEMLRVIVPRRSAGSLQCVPKS